MIHLILIVVTVLIGLCVLFCMRRNASTAEGFGAFQNESKKFADKQSAYFHDTAAKGIFTNSGLNLAQFNSAVRSPDLYVPTSLDRDYTSYFVEDPESAFTEKDKALCRGATHPRFLPVRARKSSVACGWWFVSDSTIPSVGVLGTRDGPVFRDLPASGEWIWDINVAAQKEDIKRCKSVTSCELMDLPGIIGECGFCESNGYAVPIDSSGRVKYPESETGSCGEDTKNTSDRCSKPEPPPYTTENGIFCGNAGKASPDGRTRVYTVDECSTLGGSLQAGGNCMRSDGGSFSEDCAPLNSPTYATSLMPPNVCEPTAQGRLTKACLSSLVLNLGYSKAGAIYTLLNSTNPTTATDREAIAVLAKAGVSVPNSILGGGDIDVKSAGTLYKKILDTTYKGASSQIKEAARWLAVGSEAFDACDYAIGQPGPFGTNCLQRAFRSAGCQASGAKNPNERTAPLYANMTWAEVNSKFTRMFADTRSGDPDAQDAAMRDCLGITYVRVPPKTCGLDVVNLPNTTTNTWNEMKKVCTDKGQQLCSASEMCPSNQPIAESNVFDGKDNWMAVGDKQNQWITYNTADNRKCKVHDQVVPFLPAWGNTKDPVPFYKAAKCCPDWTETAVKGNWIRDPQGGARLQTIAIGNDESIFGTNTQQQIWRKQGINGGYSQMPGALVQVDAKSPSLVVGVNAGGQVFRWAGNDWQRIGERARWVSIGSDGTIVCVNNQNGSMWRYLGRVDAWEQIYGGATQIAVGNRNDMYHLNGADQIFKWVNGSSWVQMPGALTRIAVSSGGKVAGVNRQGNIFVYSNAKSDWRLVPGGLTNISISENYMAGTNSNSEIYFLKI